MSRFIVTMTGGVPAIAKLKANLPRPWILVFVKKSENDEVIAICEAPDTSTVWEEALELILQNALGDTDFEWWHEKEYTAATTDEKAALERLKLALAVRCDNLSRIRKS